MNRLAQSHSPYLLQHRNNPVDWWPWCDEAFDQSLKQDRPVFLSIGYAACHWCHVMEHESFENETIAKFLNDHFVSIKVDREERPDLDSIYMNAVQLMTGRGGWPMSVFLDHQRRPFYAGTYWPPTPRQGMPGFAELLDAIHDAWKTRRDDVTSHSQEMTQALTQLASHPAKDSSAPASPDDVHAATIRLVQSADQKHGGFGTFPKFPHATDLLWLLRRHAQSPDPSIGGVIQITLDRMAAGGIRDHIGGGFSRYSVDAQWLVPHFEKMLYDNALLALVYTRAATWLSNSHYQRVAVETLKYMDRELFDPSGGLHCSEDADSEGVEGKYYVWNPKQIEEVLGAEDANIFCMIFDITETGNFEGSSIPNLRQPISTWAESLKIDTSTLEAKLAEFCDQLRVARSSRVKPGRDDKLLTDWNAMAMRAFAIAGGSIDSKYLDVAVRIGNFIRNTMTREDGRLWHAFRQGHCHIDAFLDDYAFACQAFVDLYENTGEESWLESAVGYARILQRDFEDTHSGGFYATSSRGETLITRQKEWHDSSLVSGNATAASTFMRLASLTGDDSFRTVAERTLSAGAFVVKEQSAAAGALVQATDEYHHPRNQWILALANQEMIPDYRTMIAAKPRLDTTIIWRAPGANDGDHPPAIFKSLPTLQTQVAMDGQDTLYPCQGRQCDPPVVGQAAITAWIRSATKWPGSEIEVRNPL